MHSGCVDIVPVVFNFRKSCTSSRIVSTKAVVEQSALRVVCMVLVPVVWGPATMTCDNRTHNHLSHSRLSYNSPGPRLSYNSPGWSHNSLGLLSYNSPGLLSFSSPGLPVTTQQMQGATSFTSRLCTAGPDCCCCRRRVWTVLLQSDCAELSS